MSEATPQRPPNDAHSGPAMSERKAQHLSICLDGDTYTVETGSTRLNEVHFVHHALPEINADAIDTSTTFLDHQITMPVFISSMTGGSSGAYQVNKQLATVAEELGIPVGMGSIRILLRKPEVLEHFLLKRYAPSVPVFANIGGVQLPEVPHDEIYSLIDTLQVDAIAIHLNPGQEMIQPGGDRNFEGILEEIGRFVDASPVPVIVKETGFGIHPRDIARLQAVGVSYVDIAGGGGTNWNRVEAYRQDDPIVAAAAAEFDEWGLPTGIVLGALGRDTDTAGILASGGIRNGMDVLKSVALGADAAGLALPFVRAIAEDGVPGAVAFGKQLQYVIRTGMALTGCTSITDLRSVPMWVERSFRSDAAAVRDAMPNEPGRPRES
jgi:isopentenyl-diphosphate delta-isomerase